MNDFIVRLKKIMANSLWVSLIFGLVGFCLYVSTLQAGFLYDDHEFIVDNPLARQLDALVKNWQIAGTKWMTYLTFVVNYQLSGHEVVFYHVFNLAVHVGNAILLYQLILWLFRTPRLRNDASQAVLMAFLSSLIFLVHPFQTESVSYLWQRSELLNAFFYLAALNFYLWARIERKVIGYLGMTVAFAVGFYAKGFIVSLPLLLVLIEDAFFDVPYSRRLSLWTVRICGYGLLMWVGFSSEIKINLHSIYSAIITLSGAQLAHYHLFAQADAISRLLILALFPVYQNADHTLNPHWSFFQMNVLLPVGFLLLLIFVVIRFWNTQRLFAFGVMMFFVSLLPSTLLGGREPMVEHRFYFPLAGIAISLVSCLRLLKDSAVWSKGLVVGVVIFYALLTVNRNQVWRSEQALFEDTVRKSPFKARPALMLGTVYMTQARYEDAYRLLHRAAQLDPNCAEAYNNLGYIMQALGQGMEAENDYEKAIAVNKKFGPAYINLGYIALAMGDDDRAWGLFNQAIAVGAEEAGNIGLGNVCLARRQFNQASTYFSNVIRQNPLNTKARYSLGELYLRQRKGALALEQFKEVKRLMPQFPQIEQKIQAAKPYFSNY